MKKNKRYLFYISQNYSFSILRPLQEVILARGDSCLWFVEGNEVNLSFFSESEKISTDFSEVIKFAADAVFVPGNIVPSFIPGLKIQVFHGLPSRKVKKNGQLYHYIIRGMFDLYCTQGPESTKKFKILQDKYQFFNVQETGWSKLDPLFYAEPDASNRSADNLIAKKTIFFASTFSPSFSKAEVLFPLVTEMMKDKDIDWYITLHPKMNAQMVERYRQLASTNVKFIEPTEFAEYFKKSDMMLCDTSSIIYEFLTLLKPVVTFQTEKDEDCLINVENINRLEETIHKVLQNPQINQRNIVESVSIFHPYRDGKSSVRVIEAVDDMLAGKNIPKRSKPRNLLRNLKLRRKLRYWKW